ncbi:MAG TPA: metallophosphoesterase family protein [Gemmataceae bacterium]|jgi:diadenosine tetraphosphatase ApaH/serine/threonine PP2A family protein phosphatase|nr:metallophosphoesterase family protein [Gemmataceae bacterium]
MKAILSDIHGNLEALQAVLADASRQGAHEIYCLGDLVGYGPNPRECVDLAMHWKLTLLGDFDHEVVQDATGPGTTVSQATNFMAWARAQLNAPVPSNQQVAERWAFLANLPRQLYEGALLFVHGSPRDPLNEYVFPEDIYNQRKMQRIFGLVEHCCFLGHTHVPGIFNEQPSGDTFPYVFQSPEEFNYVSHLDDRKMICNVGSVGQPRDSDWRACYVLLDEDTIRFRRVEYDLGKARVEA